MTIGRTGTMLGMSGVLLMVFVPIANAQRRGSSIADVQQFNVPYDGTFTFLRLRYAPLSRWGRWGGREPEWAHDWPRAERHLNVMLEEFTLVAPNMKGSNIFDADDPEIFKYPVVYISEPGFWSLSGDEETNLRDYVLKGGFLIFDDFAGSHWYNFEDKITRVLPGVRPVRLDGTHQIFHAFYDIESLDGFVHPLQGIPSEFYGIFEDNDPNGRMFGIVNYNNDIGEAWEWSDTGWIPVDLTNDAYKLGINYIIYAMTH
jgi:hypothetical protein